MVADRLSFREPTKCGPREQAVPSERRKRKTRNAQEDQYEGPNDYKLYNSALHKTFRNGDGESKEKNRANSAQSGCGAKSTDN